MKKLLLAAVALTTVSMSSFAQQRLALHEEITGENCGPCASTNPGFWSLCNGLTNPSKMIHIAYMSPIPSSGFFYLRSKTVNDARRSYYGITSAPSGKFDGTATGSGHPASFTQAHIDAQYAVASPFNMSVTNTWNAAYDSVITTVTITPVTMSTAPLVLRAALIQTVDFSTPPGTNGETHFENIVQDMYPSASGTPLPVSTWSGGVGVPVTFTIRGKVPAFVEKGASPFMVVWIQDDADKNIKQSAKGAALPNVPLDAAATSITAAPFSCAANGPAPLAHTVLLKNSGINTLTSATIYSKVGSGTSTSYSWTGSLATGATEVVTVPAPSASITGAGFYMINDSVDNPNASTDMSYGNNATSKSVFVQSTTGLGLPYTTSFETTEQGKYYLSDDNTNTAKWGVYVSGTSTSMGHTGTYAAAFVNYGYPAGESEIITIPNTSYTATSELTFWSSHAQRATTNTDMLEVVYSTNCGTSWTSAWSLSGTALASAAVSASSLYVPVASSYVQRSVSLSSVPAGAVLAFRATNGGGNTIAIDDIDIHATSSVASVTNTNLNVSVFPNPATEKATVTFNLATGADVTVNVIDGLGRTVSVVTNGTLNTGAHSFDINTAALASGVYSVVINADGATFTQRLSVIK